MNAKQLNNVRDGIMITALDGKADPAATGHAKAIFDQLRQLPLASQLIPDAHDVANGPHGRRSDSARVDSQTLAFFARELEYVYTETAKEEYPDLRMANGDLLVIDSSVPEGARTFSYYLYGAVGVARFMRGYSSGTMPLVTIKGAKVTGNVEPMEGGYAYTTADARESQESGMHLDTELAEAERRAHDELLHKTGLWGREDLGLPGLLNHPNIIQSTPGTSSGPGDDTWPNKTPAEIIADVATLIHTVDEVTFGIEQVNTVQLPRARYNFIKTLKLADGDGVWTVLRYLKDMFPEVSFEVLNELDGDHSGGNIPAGTMAMFAYTKGNKKKASLIAPMAFKQYPVQQVALQFLVPCESSTGGVMMKSPLMCNSMRGI